MLAFADKSIGITRFVLLSTEESEYHPSKGFLSDKLKHLTLFLRRIFEQICWEPKIAKRLIVICATPVMYYFTIFICIELYLGVVWVFSYGFLSKIFDKIYACNLIFFGLELAFPYLLHVSMIFNKKQNKKRFFANFLFILPAIVNISNILTLRLHCNVIVTSCENGNGQSL